MKFARSVVFLLVFSVILGTVFSLRILAGAENGAAIAPEKIGADWIFNKDDFTGGWAEVRGSLTEVKVKGGVLSMTISGEDPWFQSPQNLNIDTGKFKNILVKMKISGVSSDSGQIFWITETDREWNDQKTCGFPIVTDGQWHTYNINMSPYPTWKGRLSGFRIDPIAIGSYGRVEIARIALTEAPLPPEQPEQAKQPVSQPAIAPEKIGTDWIFNKDDSTGGWAEVRASLTEVKVKGGVLSMTINGEDPWFQGPQNLNIDIGRFKNILIKMKISGVAADRGQIFWVTESDREWNEQKCLDFPIVTDGQWHTYSINMSPYPTWKGRLSGFRIDPIASGSYGKVEIARIALTEAPLPPE